jgi:hypothetical protein
MVDLKPAMAILSFPGDLMNLRNRPFLVLAFAALMSMVCRCSSDTGTPVTLTFSNGTSVQCTQYTDYPSWSPNYDCKIPCPDGSTVKVAEFSSVEINKAITEKGRANVQILKNLQAQSCPPAKTATKAPTTKPPATKPPATKTPVGGRSALAITNMPILPLLTGNVSACDLNQGFINFNLVQPPPDIRAKTLRVKINDVEVRCAIPSTNPNVISCNLPQGLKRPASVVVFLDDIQVNNFVYSGSSCVQPTSTPKKDRSSPSVIPTPSIVPSPTDFQG